MAEWRFGENRRIAPNVVLTYRAKLGNNTAMTDDPYAIMQSYSRPGPKSAKGRAIIEDRDANRAAEQERAVRLVKKFLKEDDVTQMVAASGFGKTWVAHKLIADASRSNAQYVAVVIEPGVLLVDQAKKHFAEYLGDRMSQFDLVAVCSDAEAKRVWGEFNYLNLAQFRARLRAGTHRRTIVITTNASAAKVGVVLRKHGAADLKIVDEAHHGSGSANRPQVKSIHSLPAVKTVFMTATQKVVASRVVNRRSMDDPAYFGDVAYDLTAGASASQHIIAPSVLAFLSVGDDATSSMFDRLGEEGFRIPGKHKIKAFKSEVAAAIVTVRCLAEGGLKRILTFHNRKESAENFSELLTAVAEMLGYPDLWFGNVTENTRQRHEVMDEFIKVERGALSSCRVLAEGYDLPSVDGVVIVEPRMSPIDVAQTISRGSRFDPLRPGKKNVVIIPVLGDGSDAHSVAFSAVRSTLSALNDMDGSVVGIMYDMAGFQRPQSLDEPMRGSPTVISDLSPDVARTVSLQLFDPGIASWETKYQQLAELGYVPPQREMRLGEWCNQQRTLKKMGILSLEKQGRLEELPFWAWAHNDPKWWANYAKLKDVGFVPNKRHDRLGLWASNQKTQHRTGKLAADRVIALESLPFWSWIHADGPRGENNGGGRKLRRADVEEIVTRLRSGERGSDIAEDLGVSPTMISYIKTGRQWTHVTGGPVATESYAIQPNDNA
jgi:superfamily II DNA or RNA helicase